MPHSKTYTAGARAIVEQMIEKLDRDLEDAADQAKVNYIIRLRLWVKAFPTRYNAKAGGVGRKQKKVSK